MNKILVDENDQNLQNINGILEISGKSNQIHLSGQNKIFGIHLEPESTLIINLEDQTTVDISLTWPATMSKTKLIFNSKNETSLNCRINIDVSKELNLELQSNISGNQNQTNIALHVVTEENANCYIKSSGFIQKNTIDNQFAEELKGLTLESSTITFLPDLLVDSDSVIATHNATIKQIEKEELFYLESKGIKELEAKELIKRGFLNQVEEEVENESF